MKIKNQSLIALCLLFVSLSVNAERKEIGNQIQFVPLDHITIKDSFWSPKFHLWSTVTVNDILDKFEGKHLPYENREANNTFTNFDKVAKGEKGTHNHVGLPWFDGLVYETIRGIADLLILYPDVSIENRVDTYIDRIEKAQLNDENGYINTYVDLEVPTHRWGDNGGFLRFQHDVYNAGMLVEAGVHYYKATGKVKLLEVATRFANYMCRLMGPAPKRNIVPSHSGPEEALVKLYWLYKEEPELKSKISIPVHEKDYFDLVEFWYANRGNHCGYPLWLEWGNDKAEEWIRQEKYNDSQFGVAGRPTWGDYAQDSISVFEQQTIEGHAVRATLLSTGLAAVALENNSTQYKQTADRLWDNMVGRRMFVTGGVGAIYHDEKFGPDYFLPSNAYLETCAAVGVGFFSQRMNELMGDSKYIDEYERALYNNVLTGISLDGNKYTYQNPLNADHHERWEWHSCPCCPPMFLKMISSFPTTIYAYDKESIYVNLFVGSEVEIPFERNNIKITQETNYPWNGDIKLTINPSNKREEFSLKVRVPGWSKGVENPYGLYHSNLTKDETIQIVVNGKRTLFAMENGYATLHKKWKKGDVVELTIPMQSRIIKANNKVNDLKDKAALAFGPLIYCVEEVDNTDWSNVSIQLSDVFTPFYDSSLPDIKMMKNDRGVIAVPYYAIGNRTRGAYKVWVSQE